jgi:hypothetical protein
MSSESPDRFWMTDTDRALGAALLIALTPAGKIVGFTPLSWPLIGLITLLFGLYLLAAELIKSFAMARIGAGIASSRQR